MANWPEKPLIRIIKGYDSGKLREDIIAYKCKGGNSYRGDNCHIVRGYPRDSIDEWEEVTAVPAAALKRLQDTFRGIDVIESLEPPLLEVLSYLPADKPSPLDQAVTRVKDENGLLFSAHQSNPARLSLLLSAISDVPAATNKVAVLTAVARICTEWADMEDLRRDALEDARGRAEALSITGDFTTLSSLVGYVATTLCEDNSPRCDLIDVGAYALAWAAQTIEEEDK